MIVRSETARWLILAVLALLLIGLIAYARGPEHRRGDDVGALPGVALVEGAR
jgi:cbb3-type cytochrome oxidase subunit 3